MANVKTITATTTESAVEFSATYQFMWFRNFGENDCYICAHSGIVAGADDVTLLKAGEVARLTLPQFPAQSKAYIKAADGNNTVEVHAQNFSDCPFKVSAKGGGSGGDGTHFKGTTTTALTDGATTNPITVDGESYTAVKGDIVIYNSTEFIFDGSAWQSFGGTMDTQPTKNSAKAVTSDGVYRYTAGQKEFVSSSEKGEIFNIYSGNYKNVATGTSSHAEGFKTSASGNYSHAEGNNTKANSNNSHAEGNKTKATGTSSHAEGETTIASGDYSHSEGISTEASGYASHAGGTYTKATAHSSTVIGRYNVADGTGSSDPKHLFIVGNGANDNTRSNILEVSDSYLNVNGDIKKNGVSISPLVYDAQTESFVFGGVSNG